MIRLMACASALVTIWREFQTKIAILNVCEPQRKCFYTANGYVLQPSYLSPRISHPLTPTCR